jgi:hypothetical protein
MHLKHAFYALEVPLKRTKPNKTNKDVVRYQRPRNRLNISIALMFKHILKKKMYENVPRYTKIC